VSSSAFDRGLRKASRSSIVTVSTVAVRGMSSSLPGLIGAVVLSAL